MKSTLTAGEALGQLLNALGEQRMPAETIPVDEALGRTTAAAAAAALSSPHYPAAAMDGFAVRAGETAGASGRSPVRLRLGRQAQPVDTGDPLPPGFDAVVLNEESTLPDGSWVEVRGPAVRWQHVRTIGEDLVESGTVLSEGTRIGPPELGALLAAGIPSVSVRRRPRVAFLPTGTELVPPGAVPAAGQLVEFNSRMILAQVEEWGGVPLPFPITADDPGLLRQALRQALAAADVVLINAGSSAGREDHTFSVLQELGEVLVRGVAIKPGRPAMLAVAGGKPVVGLPGYPVAAWLAADLFVKPLLARLLGRPVPRRPSVPATLTETLTSPAGVDEYLRVHLLWDGIGWRCTPFGRGAASVSTLVRAGGLLCLPAGVTGAEAGATVTVELLCPDEELKGRLLITGEEEPALDLLDSLLRRSANGVSLLRVAAADAATAVARGGAHLAALAVPDGAAAGHSGSGAGVPAGLRQVHVLRREIGLLTRQGTAAAEPGERFPALRAAAAVAGGMVDAAWGTRAAARAMGLDFRPAGWERVELLVPEWSAGLPAVRHLLEALSGPAFRTEVSRLDGYDPALSGTVLSKRM